MAATTSARDSARRCGSKRERSTRASSASARSHGRAGPGRRAQLLDRRAARSGQTGSSARRSARASWAASSALAGPESREDRRGRAVACGDGAARRARPRGERADRQRRPSAQRAPSHRTPSARAPRVRAPSAPAGVGWGGAAPRAGGAGPDLEHERGRGRDGVAAQRGIEVGHAQLRDLDPALPGGDDVVGEPAAHGELDAGLELEPRPRREDLDAPRARERRAADRARPTGSRRHAASPRGARSRRARAARPGRDLERERSRPGRRSPAGGLPRGAPARARAWRGCSLRAALRPRRCSAGPSVRSRARRGAPRTARAPPRARATRLHPVSPRPRSGCPGSHSARKPGKAGGSSHSTFVTSARRRISSRQTICCPG